MPTSAEPFPYVDSRKIEPGDYFGHRTVSSPLVNNHDSRRSSSTTCKAARPLYASRHEQRPGSGTILQTPMSQASRPGPLPSIQISANPKIGLKCKEDFGVTPVQSSDVFLDRNSTEVHDTIVTVCKPVPKNQLQNNKHLTSDLSLEGQSMSLQSFPPGTIKNPVMAQKSLASHFQEGENFLKGVSRLAIQNSLSTVPKLVTPTTSTSTQVLESDRKRNQLELPNKPLFNIPIITTTGYRPQQHHPLGQLDGLSDFINEVPAVQSPHRNSNKVPLRTSSFMKARAPSKSKVKTQSQVNQDTAISSEHLLDQTKQRTAELCRKESPVKEVDVKNIPISISTSPPMKENRKIAQSAALIAARNSASVKDQMPLKDQKGVNNQPRPKTVREGPEGTGSRSGMRKGHEVQGEICTYERRLIITDGSVGTKYGLDDKLVVWHPTLAKVERNQVMASQKKGRDAEGDMKAAKGSEDGEECQVSFQHALSCMLPTAWWLIEPIFNPESAWRKRWEGNMNTWKDISILIIAGIFGLCLGLMVVVCGRMVGMCLRMLSVVMGL